MTDLLGGQIQLMFEIMPTALPQIRSGKLRVLAVTSAQRMPTVPDIPTVAESGVPSYEMATWHGVLGPAGMPREIVLKLNTWLNNSLHSASLQERFAALGLRTEGGTPEEFGAFV